MLNYTSLYYSIGWPEGRTYICIYVYIYIYTHTYICVYIYIYICITKHSNSCPTDGRCGRAGALAADNAGWNRFGSIRFGSGHLEISSVRFGSVRFGNVCFPVRRGWTCVFRTHRGSIRFGSVPRPVPAGSRIEQFGSIPVRFGFLVLPGNKQANGKR